MRHAFRSGVIVFLLSSLVVPAVLASNASVTIQNFSFVPPKVQIDVGDAVTWTNRDTVPHSIHWTSGGLTDSAPLVLGASFAQTFRAAGTYDYICGIHGAVMSGTVLVGPTPTPTRSPTPPPPSPTASPSASASPSATPSATPTTRTPSPTASPRPSVTPSGTPLPAPATQANQLIGVALVLVGVVILGGAFWWRFGTRS